VSEVEYGCQRALAREAPGPLWAKEWGMACIEVEISGIKSWG